MVNNGQGRVVPKGTKASMIAKINDRNKGTKFKERENKSVQSEPMDAKDSGKRKPGDGFYETEEDYNRSKKIFVTENESAEFPALLVNQSQKKSSNNKGPYGVWIRKIKMDETELSAYKIGSILYKNYTDFEVRRRNKFKSEILFKSFKDANKLLTDKSLADHNIECFLPNHRLQRRGIVRYIPTEFSEERIIQASKSSVKVVDARRLNMRNKDATSKENKWIPSQTVLLTFEGQILPKDLYIFNVKTSVEAYVPKPMQCFTCFTYGHTSKNCRRRKRCIMCGEEDHDGDNCGSDTPCCANCEGRHKSIDSKCSVYQEQLKINTIMAFDHVSFEEAKQQIFRRHNNSDVSKTKKNFPHLEEKNTILSNTQSYAERTQNVNRRISNQPPLSATKQSTAESSSNSNKNNNRAEQTSLEIEECSAVQQPNEENNYNKLNPNLKLNVITNKLAERLKADSSNEDVP